jgi:hypothetical protein
MDLHITPRLWFIHTLILSPFQRNGKHKNIWPNSYFASARLRSDFWSYWKSCSGWLWCGTAYWLAHYSTAMIHPYPDLISFPAQRSAQEDLVQLLFCIFKSEVKFLILLNIIMQWLWCAGTAHWLAHYSTAMIHPYPDLISLPTQWSAQENLNQLLFCIFKSEVRFLILLKIMQWLWCGTANWLAQYPTAMLHPFPVLIS